MKITAAFTQSVQQYIEINDLAVYGHTIIVGVSGGPDSMALLHWLCQQGYSCIAAHCNFHLRHEESDRDEQFVRDICRQWGIALEVIHFDTRQEAQAQRESIEMAARRLRYEWFETLRVKYQANSIAVAHHRDDSAETLLLNLVRGTGIKGLSGILPKQGVIIRPLLCVSREDVMNYLEDNGLDSVQDSSNLSHEYLRNRIRHEVVPLLTEMNPSIVETLAKTSVYMQQAATMLESSTRNYHIWVEQGVIPIDALLAQASPEFILHELIAPLGFNSSQQSSILTSAQSGQSGRQFESKTGWRILRERDELLICAPKKEEEVKPNFRIEFTQYSSTSRLPSFSKRVALIDADSVSMPMHLRPWRQGDKFSPYGMDKGRKLVSDFLTDRKVSMLQRENLWVLCDVSDNIVWVVGQEISHRHRVCVESKTVLCMRYVSIPAVEAVNSAENEDFGIKYL